MIFVQVEADKTKEMWQMRFPYDSSQYGKKKIWGVLILILYPSSNKKWNRI